MPLSQLDPKDFIDQYEDFFENTSLIEDSTAIRRSWVSRGKSDTMLKDEGFKKLTVNVPIGHLVLAATHLLQKPVWRSRSTEVRIRLFYGFAISSDSDTVYEPNITSVGHKRANMMIPPLPSMAPNLSYQGTKDKTKMLALQKLSQDFKDIYLEETFYEEETQKGDKIEGKEDRKKRVSVMVLKQKPDGFIAEREDLWSPKLEMTTDTEVLLGSYFELFPVQSKKIRADRSEHGWIQIDLGEKDKDGVLIGPREPTIREMHLLDASRKGSRNVLKKDRPLADALRAHLGLQPMTKTPDPSFSEDVKEQRLKNIRQESPDMGRTFLSMDPSDTLDRHTLSLEALRERALSRAIEDDINRALFFDFNEVTDERKEQITKNATARMTAEFKRTDAKDKKRAARIAKKKKEEESKE